MKRVPSDRDDAVVAADDVVVVVDDAILIPIAIPSESDDTDTDFAAVVIGVFVVIDNSAEKMEVGTEDNEEQAKKERYRGRVLRSSRWVRRDRRWENERYDVEFVERKRTSWLREELLYRR